MIGRVVTPLEALRLASTRCRGADPAPAAVESAAGAFLAQPVAIRPLAARRDLPCGSRVAAVDGYALPPGFAGGSCRFRSARLRGEAPLPAAAAGDVVLELLESGDAVPEGADRLLPAGLAVITGPGQVRIELARIPPAGSGIEPAPGSEWILPAGALLDPRTQALLLSQGVHEVMARPSWEVGFAGIGSDLADVLALEEARRGDADLKSGDITGFWLPAALRKLGLSPRPLGLIEDEPEEIIAALLRASRLRLRTVILSGGLGSGISDRTVEALRSAECLIAFEGVAAEPGGRFLLAQGFGADILALGGSPLDAAAAFDLFAAPALLRARGAPPEVWDWSRRGHPGPPPGHPPTAPDAPVDGPWPVSAIETGTGMEIPHRSRFLPGLPGQWGWEVRAPGAAGRSYRVRSRVSN